MKLQFVTPQPCVTVLVFAAALALLCPRAWSQPPVLPAPYLPASPQAGEYAPVDAPTAVDELVKRLNRAEDRNRELSERLERMQGEHQNQTDAMFFRLDELTRRLNDQELNAGGDVGADADRWSPDTIAPEYADPEQLRNESVPDYFDLDTTSPYAIPGRVTFGPGFQIQSADEDFTLQIHYESQIEGRVWSQDDQLPANSGFFLPRQRFFFNGNITKLIEYELAINRGVNNINLLNAFINFHFSDQFKVRIGRFFTPFTYDQYAISNYWLLTTERSLFTTNLSPNRQLGAMALGSLFEKRLDYAAGFFNGSRNSFESRNYGLDFVAFLNARPFQHAGLPLVENLNLGASVATGQQDQPPVPVTFRVGAGSPDANIPGIATVPFLVLNPGVIEQGDRLLGSVHAAYFYRSLSLIGEWQYGYGNYASAANPTAQEVPFSGYYIKAGYFLTGEQIERRTRVRPLRPLIPLNAQQERGLGAWEPIARVSRLQLGDEVFTGGFADPTIWSNTALTTEVGVNWYWNDYVKFYFLWLNADFGEPV
jgi:phosphate-selective porin OprO/OprP